MCPKSLLTYQLLEERIASWAVTRPELLAGVVVGSRGRPRQPVDQWSDLDMIIFTSAVEILTGDDGWLEDFGEVWASWLSNTGSGYPECFALYAGGFKLDIAIVSVLSSRESSLVQMLNDFAHQDVLQRGVRILFDKTNGAGLPESIAQPTTFAPPTPQQFRSAINQFWIIATRTIKLVQRGDLWRAKQACDSEMKACLLSMLEWHAQAIYGPQHDTWYEGRHLSEWADPRALESLLFTFASYDQADLHRALLVTVDLYQWLAGETAARLGYPFPSPQDEAILNWIKSA